MVRQRIGAIGREAVDRVRDEMKQLGRKISETKEKASNGGSIRDEERGRRLTNPKSDRARSL